MRLKCLSVGKREQPQDRGLLATAGDGIEPGGESRGQLIQAPSQRVMLQHPVQSSSAAASKEQPSRASSIARRLTGWPPQRIAPSASAL